MADFDPDAYLAEPFNPDEFLSGGPPGMGDLQLAEAKREAIETQRNVPAHLLTGYPIDRQRAEAFAEAGQTSRPLTGKQAGAAAATLAGALTPALFASPIVGGAVGGGITAAGTSDAESVPEFVEDVGAGGAVGAALPPVFQALGKAAGPFARWLGEKATKYGRRAITGVTAPLARRKELPQEAVEAAFRAGAIKPLSTVEGTANRLQAAVDPVAERYTEILRNLEAAGVTGPNAQKLAAQLASEGAEAEANSIIGTRASALKEAAEKLTGAPGGHMRPPIPPKPTDPEGNLRLMQAELMKRELQRNAASEFVKEGPTSLSGEARKEIAGRFKDAIEEAVAAQAGKAPLEAAQFQPVKEELHNLLAALGPAREASARLSRRSTMSLPSAMGLASGIAGGNPLAGAEAAAALSAINPRLASTLASAARSGSEALGSLSRAGVSPGTAAVFAPIAGRLGPPSLEELVAFLRSRGLGVRLPAPAGAEEGDR